jgi:uncharacterized cupin superfamily protein
MVIIKLMSLNKKFLIFGLIIMVICGFSAVFFILKDKGDKDKISPPKTEQNFSPTPAETKKGDDEQKIAFWKEKVEEKEINLPSIERFTFQGELRVREKGEIEKVIEPGKLYQLNLSFHGTNIGEINEKTYLGRTTFGYNKKGDLLAVEYTPVTPEEIIQINPGQEVIVSFKQDELLPEKNIPLLEFVLIFKQ